PRAGEPGQRVRGGDGGPLAPLVPEAEPAVPEPEAGDRVDEPGRPAAAPELAVGHGADAQLGLQGDHLPDARVLDGAEVLGPTPPGPGLAGRRQQALGPQEAPDVLRPERTLR